MARRKRTPEEIEKEKQIELLRERLREYDRSKRADASQYDRHRERMAKRSREKSAAARDIGELPPCVNPERRAAGLASLRVFCETYFGRTFCLPWSQDHLRVIETLDRAVSKGGQFAVAMPRGSGKTSLCEAATIWSAFGGWHEFTLLIGPEVTLADNMLASIKAEIETNERLAEDFPEIIYPILCLDGSSLRCAGQTYNGVRTRIVWTNDKIVLPTIEGSPASGCVVMTAGITGRIRGAKHKMGKGRTVRPSLVILDDPQTDATAKSKTMTEERLRILNGAVLGLAGPGRRISAVMPCTVIRPDDMADTVLNRDKHPEWNGERTRMMYSFPKSEARWAEYWQIRRDGIRLGDDGAAGNEYYLQHRAEMDLGAVVAWPERFEPNEISAVQHAMNIRFARPEAFAAEYQNDPLPALDSLGQSLDADTLAVRFGGVARGKIPHNATRLVGFVDVQAEVLYYALTAWSEDYTGIVIDYGAWPRQYSTWFSARDPKPSLSDLYPKHAREAAIYAGLRDLTTLICQPFSRVDGGDPLRVERLMIDASWGEQTETVYQFCRQSQFGAVLTPSHGHGLSPTSRPMAEWKGAPTDRTGLNWRLSTSKRGRHLVFDANFWKTFAASRLTTPPGSPGCLQLFGTEGDRPHEYFAQHLTSEHSLETPSRGRVIHTWHLLPGRENHWWDCVVGCCVAASMQGAVWSPHGPGESPSRGPAPRRRLKLSELREQKLKGR